MSSICKKCHRAVHLEMKPHANSISEGNIAAFRCLLLGDFLDKISSHAASDGSYPAMVGCAGFQPMPNDGSCPYCGGNQLYEESDECGELVYIGCMECKAIGPHSSDEVTARNRWQKVRRNR